MTTGDEIIKAFNVIVKNNNLTYAEHCECADDIECLFDRRDIIRAIKEGIKLGEEKARKEFLEWLEERKKRTRPEEAVRTVAEPEMTLFGPEEGRM